MGHRSPIALAAPLAGLLVLALGMTPAPAATQATIYERIPFWEADPSSRSAAMGGASGAVFWGDEPDHWANPALLGFVSGMHYEDGRDYLMSNPGLPYVSRRATLGHGGLGASFAGEPFDGFGKLDLSSTTRDDLAGSVVTARWYDRVRSWGVGASVSDLLETVARIRHREAPAFTRHVGLAFGYSEKVAETRYEEPGFLDARGRGVSRDLGVLARTGLTLAGGGDHALALPLRLDAAYGLSIQNSGEGEVRSPPSVLGPYLDAPIQRHLRNALSACAALGAPDSWRTRLPALLAPALDHLVSLGLAYDAEHLSSQSAPMFNRRRNHEGAELGLTNLLAFQLGHVEGANDWGCSIALPLGRVAGARYAHAVERLNDSDSPNTHDTWSVWIDPFALRRGNH